MENLGNLVDVHDHDWMNAALAQIEKFGVAALRNLTDAEAIDELCQNAKKILAEPSLLGSVGYFQKDPFKRTCDGFLLGKTMVNLISDERILQLFETYLQDKVMISEIFLKQDLGSNDVYFPFHRHHGEDLKLDGSQRFGLGILIYLHDTNEGAFCYSLGSHNLSILDGDSLMSRHEKNVELEEKIVRINGKKGDVIVFDERGFHGPEQPVKTPRTAIISAYRGIRCTNGCTRTGIPVIISDLRDLSARQLGALGVGGGALSRYEDYHLHNISNTRIHRILAGVARISMKTSLAYQHLKRIIK